MTYHPGITLVLVIFAGCYAGEQCSYKYEGGGSVKQLYCEVSCCGTYYQRYCCTVTSTALYIGAVVGGVVCVILIIGIVICCVYKGKTPVRRHRHVNNGNRPDDFQCARIYFNDSPKPPPYSLHHLHPPEYHEDPPPRYMTPIPAPDYNTIPGITADDHM